MPNYASKSVSRNFQNDQHPKQISEQTEPSKWNTKQPNKTDFDILLGACLGQKNTEPLSSSRDARK